MTGLNWLKNQRRERTKSARNPAVIARSRAPNGSRALVDTDGKTTRTRSRKIATRPNTETTTSGACRWGGRPVRRLSRYANGISQPTTSTNHASVSHGWVKKRVRKKRVSTGTLPYQITRYWDQKKYIHMIEIANWSFATSCTAAGGIEACPRAFARTVRSERRQNPIYRVLTTKYPPNRPLYHAGSSDITRSKPHSETPMTQRKRRTTARRFRRARSRASSGGTASRTSARTSASAAVVHDVPRRFGGQRLSVGGHHRAAGDDVAVPVSVGPLLVELGVGQVRRGDELRRHGAARTALRFGPVAWDAERLKALPADGDGRLRGLDRVWLLGRDVALLLGEDQIATAWHDSSRHREHALARHDSRRLGHVVAPADDDDRARHPTGGRHHQERQEEDVLHAGTSSAPAVRKISRTEPLRPGAQWMAMPKD